MNHCDTCESKEECLTCVNNYGLYEDKKQCIYIPELKYYKDTDNFYKLCTSKINNCIQCESSSKCIKCISNYYRKDNDNSVCHPLSEINQELYTLDPNDDNMYIKCSSLFDNCNSCNNSGCKSCKTGFIFINDDYKKCHEKSKVDLNKYFTRDDTMYYSCEEQKYKNNLECFSMIPQQNIILIFLQIQIINNKLVIFILTKTPLPINFSLKITIGIYSTGTLRNLDEEEREDKFIATSDSDGTSNKVISFISEGTYTNSDKNFHIKEMNFDNDNSVTKTVTGNNYCSLQFDSNSDLADTYKVKSLIESGKLMDFSNIQQVDFIELNLTDVKGCDLNFNSDSEFSLQEGNFEIELKSEKKEDKFILAKCSNDDNELKSIKCEVKDKTNEEYSFKNEIIHNSGKIISINSGDNDKFNIKCKKSNTTKIIIIVAIVVGCAIALAILIIVLIKLCKKKKTETLEEDSKDKKHVEGFDYKESGSENRITEKAIYAKKIDSEKW